MVTRHRRDDRADIRRSKNKKVPTSTARVQAGSKRCRRSPEARVSAGGNAASILYNRELGSIGGSNAAWPGVRRASRTQRKSCASCAIHIGAMFTRHWIGEELQSLEKDGRVADFFEAAELMCIARSMRRVLRRALPVRVSAPDGRSVATWTTVPVRAAWEFPRQASRAAQGTARVRRDQSWRRGATSEPDPHSGARRRVLEGRLRRNAAKDIVERHSRDARHRNAAVIEREEEPIPLRARYARRHLRIVRH